MGSSRGCANATATTRRAKRAKGAALLAVGCVGGVARSGSAANSPIGKKVSRVRLFRDYQVAWEVRYQAYLDRRRRQVESWRAMDLAELEIERRKLVGAAQDRRRSARQCKTLAEMLPQLGIDIG